jgi:hypothetical protein
MANEKVWKLLSQPWLAWPLSCDFLTLIRLVMLLILC